MVAGGVRTIRAWATTAAMFTGAAGLVLSEDPVLHDGPNQIAGDRVIVYLDEDRSVVEGGEKRVKAVLFPGREPKPGPRAAAP
jgi:lipopolysaccharide export system protein LptA